MSRNAIAPPTPPGLCQRAPERWADPKQQNTTRRLCLACPRLERCRVETLAENRTFGMWAGVWIDHDLPAKAHLLAPTPPAPAITAPPCRPRSRRRVGALPVNELSAAAAALVTARSSGHCEILAPACRLHQQLIFTRATPTPDPADRTGPTGERGATVADSPAAALAACSNCAELIEQTDRATAARLGYRSTGRTALTSWPVYWRQRRWVLLSHFGGLIDLPTPAQRPAQNPAPALNPAQTCGTGRG